MFLFLKFFLAHLIADLLAYTAELYHFGPRNRLENLLHALMHVIIMVILLVPYLGYRSIWVIIIALALIHLFQDFMKDDLQRSYPQFAFVFLVLDQILHLIFISSVFLFPVSDIRLEYPWIPGINFIYMSSMKTVIIILFLLSTIGGTYFLNSFRKSFSSTKDDYYLSFIEVAQGFLERGVITAAYFFSAEPLIIMASPLVGLTRFASKKLQNRFDFFLSYLYAAALGFAIRILI